MRLARLDHDPLSGVTPITMASSVQQPQHVYIGEVLHPIRNAGPQLTAEKVDVPLMVRRLKTAQVNNLTIGKACGARAAEVAAWMDKRLSPTKEQIRELVALYQERVSPHVPGVLG